MPRFCECGNDMFICQECGGDKCSKGCDKDTNLSHYKDRQASEWIEGKGNVCDRCLAIRYLQKADKTWIKVEQWKPMKGLKGNPAYDLMM